VKTEIMDMDMAMVLIVLEIAVLLTAVLAYGRD
jgi:hypothetical protein